jgi:acetyltransferase-like isoleucine patch superfamily enzyme
MAWLNRSEIDQMGFASTGENILVSDRASFHNCPNISLGNNVRVDDFCVLSAGTGGIQIGNFVHIAVYSSLIGAGRITLSDFCNISSRVSIYSSSDDYSGAAMTNPMVPEVYTNIQRADVHLGKHVIVGSGSVVLPGVEIAEGAAIGALSLVRENCRTFGIYAGTPAKFIKERKRDLLVLEQQLLERLGLDKNHMPID